MSEEGEREDTKHWEQDKQHKGEEANEKAGRETRANPIKRHK